MEAFRADLHCHSTHSDGSDSPETLLEKATLVHLQGLSITDHDTMSVYTPELFARAAHLQIRLLPGIELSTELDQTAVHILGYGYDIRSASFQSFLQEMQRRRMERNRLILKKLAKRSMPIAEADLMRTNAQHSIGRPHIAALMIKKGYVGSMQEAFERYLKDGASCYAAGFKYTPLEAVEQIHLARGKAVLAHPHVYKKSTLIKKILDYPFDGIECYYALLPRELESPWLNIAKERGWIATGGSDYHGAMKAHIPLGASWVNEATFNALSYST
ncbi:MAG: PHP domain-containing protein [Chlamydiia bacterium]|nr:PHP domain-containing protein [Chlamydiia bacterium]